MAADRTGKDRVVSLDPDQDFIGSPSGGQDAQSDDEEIEVVTDNVVTGGYILRKGTAEPRPLEQIDYPVIKITTLSMSAQANANVDAANPGASGDQKAGNDDRERPDLRQERFGQRDGGPLSSAGSTGEFVDNYELSFFDNLVSMAEGNLENYSAIQIADISANSQARGSDKSVRLTFSAPGVKTGSRVMVARIRDGSMEFVNSSAGNGTISFDVDPGNLGTFVLLTRKE